VPPADRNTPDVTMTSRAQRYVPRAVRRTTRGFALVLTLLISIYVVAEVWEETDFVRGTVWFLAFLAFLVTLRALNAAPRTVYINASLMAVLAGVAGVGLITNQNYLAEPAEIAVTAYAFVAPVLILREVLKRHEVTTDVIFGALAVYAFSTTSFSALTRVPLSRLDPTLCSISAS